MKGKGEKKLGPIRVAYSDLIGLRQVRLHLPGRWVLLLQMQNPRRAAPWHREVTLLLRVKKLPL